MVTPRGTMHLADTELAPSEASRRDSRFLRSDPTALHSGAQAVTHAPWVRWIVALSIGVAAGVVCWFWVRWYYAAAFAGTPRHLDFESWWYAARLWRAGVSPYFAGSSGAALHRDPLVYPLPALILYWPFSWLSLPAAAAAFMGVSTALLSWGITRDGQYWRLLILLTPQYFWNFVEVQWGPLLLAAALIPTLGCVFPAKPPLGFACFSYNPSWRAVVSASAVVLVSLVLFPGWPVEWLTAVRSLDLAQYPHPMPWRTPFGWILAAALIRWRTREGRLLIAMSVVPQLLCFYDQLPLLLVARNRLEALVLTLTGVLAMLAWMHFGWAYPDYRDRAIPFVMLGCYLPALIIVLRHPAKPSVPGSRG